MPRARPVQIACYPDPSAIELIQQYAAERDLSISKRAIRLLELGLAHEGLLDLEKHDAERRAAQLRKARDT